MITDQPQESQIELYPLQEAAPGSFIYAIDQALEADFCQDVIQRFEAHPEQQYPGRIGEEADHHASIKKSTDLRVSSWDDWQDVHQVFALSLRRAVKSISAIHPFFRTQAFHDDGFNVQRTNVGEYYHWHVDYGWGEKLSQRTLVALWYLNDVPGPGGTTDFEFQNLSVQPIAGRLMLFPPYWTHVHRNARLEKGVKYIATTWVSMDATI